MLLTKTKLTKSTKFIKQICLLLVFVATTCNLLIVMPSHAGNTPQASGGGGSTVDNELIGQKPNPGTAWYVRWCYFLRYPVARENGPKVSATDNLGQDVIQNGQSLGPNPVLVGPVYNPSPSVNTLQSIQSLPQFSGMSQSQILQGLQGQYPSLKLTAIPQNPTSGPVYVWPESIPFYITNVPTHRDRSTTYDPFQTFGLPVSDTQYQIIHRYNQNRFLEEFFDPERWMWWTTCISQLGMTSAANSTAALERNQASTAIDNLNPNKKGWMDNFTVNPNNVWNQIRNQLFIPMAILLLLTGAVATQARAIVAQGTTILGEVNPWEGILRSIVAIFLIPATYLVVNYGIDVNNSITKSIYENYSRIFNGADMYEDAKVTHTRAFPIRNSNDNDNAIRQPNQDPTPQQPTNFGQFEARNEQVLKDNAQIPTVATASNGQEPPGSAIGTDEGSQFNNSANRAGLNSINAGMAGVWNILNAFQIVYMLYLWCMGPIAAALWVWPMHSLRNALPSWVEGVITLSFWSLFWNTTVLLMACFKGVDETGTIIASALNWLSIASVQYAFSFSDLIGAAGQKAAASASQGMQSAGREAGHRLASAAGAGQAGGLAGSQAAAGHSGTQGQGAAAAPGPGVGGASSATAAAQTQGRTGPGLIDGTSGSPSPIPGGSTGLQNNLTSGIPGNGAGANLANNVPGVGLPPGSPGGIGGINAGNAISGSSMPGSQGSGPVLTGGSGTAGTSGPSAIGNPGAIGSAGNANPNGIPFASPDGSSSTSGATLAGLGGAGMVAGALGMAGANAAGQNPANNSLANLGTGIGLPGTIAGTPQSGIPGQDNSVNPAGIQQPGLAGAQGISGQGINNNTNLPPGSALGPDGQPVNNNMQQPGQSGMTTATGQPMVGQPPSSAQGSVGTTGDQAPIPGGGIHTNTGAQSFTAPPGGSVPSGDPQPTVLTGYTSSNAQLTNPPQSNMTAPIDVVGQSNAPPSQQYGTPANDSSVNQYRPTDTYLVSGPGSGDVAQPQQSQPSNPIYSSPDTSAAPPSVFINNNQDQPINSGYQASTPQQPDPQPLNGYVVSSPEQRIVTPDTTYTGTPQQSTTYQQQQYVQDTHQTAPTPQAPQNSGSVGGIVGGAAAAGGIFAALNNRSTTPPANKGASPPAQSTGHANQPPQHKTDAMNISKASSGAKQNSGEATPPPPQTKGSQPPQQKAQKPKEDDEEEQPTS